MAQEKMVEEIVREVLKSMLQTPPGARIAPQAEVKGLIPKRDYPLATKRPELVKTPTGKNLKDITLDKVISGELNPSDMRISPDTLRMQAERTTPNY
jgi:propanediol dehydratase small subunit